MDVHKTYITISGWRITAEPSHYDDAPMVGIELEGTGVYRALTLEELDDLLVALYAAKDDLKFLLAKQEHEKTADAQSEEKKK